MNVDQLPVVGCAQLDGINKIIGAFVKTVDGHIVQTLSQDRTNRLTADG